MSTGKKDKKTAQRLAPAMGDGIEEVLQQFPHVPVPLLRMLNKQFEYDTPREVGFQLRRLWRLAMFPTGEGLDAQELEELSSLWLLMEELCDSFPTHRDAMHELLN